MTAQIRCIHYSNESGSKEGVYFTDELDAVIDSIIPSDCTVSNDFVIDEEFPGTFPLSYHLIRE